MKTQYVAALTIASVYIDLGDKDKMFEWLNKAYDEHSTGLYDIAVEPPSESLRADPRFQDLLRRMNLPVDSSSPVGIDTTSSRSNPNVPPHRAKRTLLAADAQDRPHLNTTEFSQWNSRSDFESLVHPGGIYQDEAAHNLLRFGEGPVGNRHFASADSNGASSAHRVERFGSDVLTLSAQLVVIGQGVAIQCRFFAGRKSAQRFGFEVNQT